MSWLSNINLNTIFTKYQEIQGKDTSDSVKQKEIKNLFEKETKSETLDVKDLIQLSNKKDIDNNGELDEGDETSFFNDMKSFLYEKIAHSIVRDKDFSAEDMLEFEKYIRTEAKENNADVSDEINKLRNRMVSNLTAQFFVTTESKAYKDSAEENAKEIEETLEKLGDIKASKNNPFASDTKFNTLLNKIDRRLQGTISSSSSSETNPQSDDEDESSIGKPSREPKTSGYDWVPHTNGTDYLYKDGEILKEGFYQTQYIKNGRPGTGYSTLEDDSKGLYYESGSLKTGVSTDTGKCYVEGKIQKGGTYPATEGSYPKYNISEQGTVLSKEVLNADSTVTRTVYYVTKDIDGKETVDMNTVHRIEELRTYTLENGESEYRIYSAIEKSTDGSLNNLWEEKYEYNSDGSYTLTKHFLNSSKEDEVEKYDIYGNKFSNVGKSVWNNQLYLDGRICTDYTDDGHEPPRWYYNSYKIEGKFEYDGKTLLYKDGYKYTGLYEVENKYYEDGEIKPFAYDKENDTVYVNGDIANGVYQYTPAKGDAQATTEVKYYENGKIIENAPSEILNYLINPKSIVLANTVRMTIPTSGGEVTFTAKAMIQGQYRDAKIDNIERKDGELEGFDCSVELYKDIIYTDTYNINVEDSDGDTGKADVPILSASKLLIKGYSDEPIDLSIDGAQNPVLIDHSINFADADGNIDMKKGINIAQALTDDMSLLTNYKNVDGEWVVTTQVAFASINELQSKDKDFSARIFDIHLTALQKNDAGENILPANEVVLFNSNGQITTQDGIKNFKTAELTSNGYTLTYDKTSKETSITFNNLYEDGRQITAPNNTITIGDGMSYTIKKDADGKICKVVIHDGTTIKTYEYGDNNITVTSMKQADYNAAIELANKLGIRCVSIEYAKQVLGQLTEIKIDGITYEVKPGVDKTGLGSDNETYLLESSEFKYLYTKTNVGTEEEPKYEYKVTYSYTTSYEKDEDGNITSKVVDEIDLTEQSRVITTFRNDDNTLLKQLTFKNGLISQAKELVQNEQHDYFGWLITNDYENGTVVKQTRTKDGQPTIIQEIGTTTRTFTEETVDGDKITTEYAKFIKLGDTGNIKSSVVVEKADGKVETTSFDTNGREKTKTIKDSSGNLISEETYIYDNKGKKTGSTLLEYENGVLKSTKTKQYGFGGDAYTITDENGNVKRYTANDEEITGGLLKFENETKGKNFQISEIIRGENNKITGLVGYWSNGKRVEYTNITLDTNGIPKDYTEKFLLAENLTSTTEDDVYIEVKYENNEQKKAELSVAGTKYEVNVNGAKINDNVDNFIVTWETGANAGELYVADAMVDGFVRQRIFTKAAAETSYTSQEALFIGTVEDARKFKPQNIMITGINALEYDNDDNVVIEPSADNKITINYGRNDTKDSVGTVTVGEPVKAYEVTLYGTGTNKDTKLLVTKLENGDYVIKGDKTGAIYEFGSTSYTVKTTDGYVINYDTEGHETSRIFTIGGKSIELPAGASLIDNAANKETTVSAQVSGGPQITLIYDSETGALKSGTLVLKDSNGNVTKTVNITKNSTMSYYGDYIMTVASNNISIYDKALTNIATNSSMTIDKYKKLLAGLSAYNKLNSDKITLSSDTTYEVSNTIVKIKTSDKEITLYLDNSNNLTQYSVLTKNSNFEDTKIYNEKGEFLSRTLKIGTSEITNVDENATVVPNENTITVTTTGKDNKYELVSIYNKTDGKNTSCTLTVPKGSNHSHSIPDGATVSIDNAHNIVVSKTGSNYNINLVYDSSGTLNNTSKITVRNIGHTIVEDFDQIVVTGNYISTIATTKNSENKNILVETQYVFSTGNNDVKNMQNNKDTDACFDSLAKSKIDENDTSDNNKVIKANDMITLFNTTTDSELRAILLYFVELNSAGVAYAVNNRFNACAGDDNAINRDEWQTKIGGSRVTDENLYKIN